ncbi:hypothetical protein OKW42_001110 [Paraburkholderia sp. WC7.3d]
MIISLSLSNASCEAGYCSQGLVVPSQANGPGGRTFMSARTGTGGRMRAAGQPEDAAVIARGARTEE